MKQKVFHVITKLELGGAQKVVLMTLERLPRDRYEVGLVTGPEGLLVDWAESIPDLKRVWIPSLVREVRPLQDALTFLKMWTVFRREQPAVVHTHSSKAGILGRWAARLAGVPVIFHTVHGFGFNDFQRPWTRAIFLWLERVSTRITTKLVVVSRANAEKGEKHRVFGKDEWFLCRAAIPLQDFMKPGPRRARLSAWGIPSNRTVVGMVACFKPQKAPVDFIEMAAAILARRDDVHFVMAGDGDLRSQIEDRIRDLSIGTHVTLLGWQEDMPDVYRNLDIVVLTSLWEGLPCVFAEAMATGLPIVATNVDGAREAIVEGENGFLHEPHDIAGMAGSVEKLISDPDLRRRMGERGHARVEEFDIDASVALLESKYRESLHLN